MSCKTMAIRRLRQRFAACSALTAIATPVASRASAEPLRIRADALAETRDAGGASPAGLVVLQGEDRARPWLSAEGLVWAGASSFTGDVLVLSVRLREPHGYAEARAGRFVLATGAVRPVQIDGAYFIARGPWGSTAETFGGLSVVPRFGARSFDWVAGGRVAQSVATALTVGASYVQRREYGEISDEEVGLDFAAASTRFLDVAAFGAYDVTRPGLAEARASAAVRWDDWRIELFASQLSPGRLLPATSLFSVLGDVPSQTVGVTARLRAAPRLDLLASGAAVDVAGGLGSNGWARATLRLDDRGSGSLGLEVHRANVPGAEWTGVRAVAALPLSNGFRYSSEVEIVTPDKPNGRGIAWPWALWALSWRSQLGWEIAGAVEASSTPRQRYETEALVRLSCATDAAPSRPGGRASRPDSR